jgi:hypothetical protein
MSCFVATSLAAFLSSEAVPTGRFTPVAFENLEKK